MILVVLLQDLLCSGIRIHCQNVFAQVLLHEQDESITDPLILDIFLATGTQEATLVRLDDESLVKLRKTLLSSRGHGIENHSLLGTRSRTYRFEWTLWPHPVNRLRWLLALLGM